jgi:hypothetical protein
MLRSVTSVAERTRPLAIENCEYDQAVVDGVRARCEMR